MRLNKLWIYIFIWSALGIATALNANPVEIKPKPNEQAKIFVENKNQWVHQVLYKVDINAGSVFLQRNGLTYLFYDGKNLHNHHGEAGGHTESHTLKQATGAPNKETIKAHAFKMEFVNANPSLKTKASNPSEDIRNYYLGQDKTRWATGVRAYGEVYYEQVYKGIDFRIFENGSSLKYEFIVEAGKTTQQIRLKYKGADKIFLKDGQLHIETSLRTVVEQRPYAYQIINGEEKAVPCHFILQDSVLSFAFPKGYDSHQPLVIDPVLVFSTYSGSRADNWGYTATYDSKGNAYSGGIVFSTGFPATLGAFDMTYNGRRSDIGATYDMGILKYSADGTKLLYATYIGGSGADAPHSMIADPDDNLVIMGSTSSSNYPVSTGALKTIFGGGYEISPLGIGSIRYAQGSDIVITKLNATGQALLGSTFLGGSSNDGVMPGADVRNNINISLTHNYGDQFRGEVITDKTGNIYVATNTESSDFPGLRGAIRSRAACVVKLPPNLSALTWTYVLDGFSEDAAYSLQLDSLNNIYVAGGTRSSDFPISLRAYRRDNQGSIDGFVAKIDNSGKTLLASTFIGTPQYDQAYFVQLDYEGSVYVYGQTQGIYPVTPGKYSGLRGGQFIHKLRNDLSTSIFSTVFGSGGNTPNISPTAFLVDDCGQIYASGWGGTTNTRFITDWLGNAIDRGYVGGTTLGMETTWDAYQRSTDGSDFYVIVLNKDAASLKYATFFGENRNDGPGEHVDGGTSRFDKKGVIYHSVCASCRGSSNFPTTPGAWSRVNGTTLTTDPNCNNALFKFDFSSLTARFTSIKAGATSCIPVTVDFQNNSVNALSYLWDFGDGNTSAAVSPTHIYTKAGKYTVSLKAVNPGTCLINDFAYDTITILEPTFKNLKDTVVDYCQIGASRRVDLTVPGARNYVWQPASNLSNSNIGNPVITFLNDVVYTLTTTDAQGCTVDRKVSLVDKSVNSGFVADTLFDKCAYTYKITLRPIQQQADSYLWTLGAESNLSPNPVFVTAPSIYDIRLQVNWGSCTSQSTQRLDLNRAKPPVLAAAFGLNYDTLKCDKASVSFNNKSANAISYLWKFGDGDSSTQSSPKHVYTKPGRYVAMLTVRNPVSCIEQATATDTIVVNESPVRKLVDTTFFYCNRDTIHLSLGLKPQKGMRYQWKPAEFLNSDTLANPIAVPLGATDYQVTITDSLQCRVVKKVSLVNEKILPGLAIDTVYDKCANAYTAAFKPKDKNAWTYKWKFGGGTTINADSLAPVQLYPATQTYTFILEQTKDLCYEETKRILAFKRNPPIIKPSFDKQFVYNSCEKPTFTFNNKTVGGITYLWDFGDGDTSIAESPQHIYQRPGNYQIKLKVENPAACKEIDYAFDSIKVAKSILPTLTDNTYRFCRGDKVQLGFGIGSGYTFQWKPAFYLSDSLAAQPVANPIDTVVYQVLVRDTLGCSVERKINLWQKTLRADFVADSIRFNPCDRNYTASFVPKETNADQYLWQFGDGASVTDKAPVHLYTQNGNYNVRLSITKEQCTETSTQNILLDKKPQEVIPGFDISYNYQNCNQPAIKVINNTQGIALYKWVFGDATAPVFLPNPDNHVYPDSGTYTITMETTSADNCIQTVSKTVKVEKLTIYNSVTPNGDNINDKFIINGLRENWKLDIYNRWGKRVFRDNNYQNQWMPEELPAGTYFYLLSIPEGNHSCKGWIQVIK